MDGLNLVTAHFELNYFVGTNLSLLNQPMTGYHDKELPFRIMPVLTFCDPRLQNINRNLSMFDCFQ